MKSFRFLDRRAGYSLASLGLLLGIVVPSLVPAFASAAQLSARSITLSSSLVSATNTTYEVKFHATTAVGAFVVDFCNDSPIPLQTCTAPTGFSVSGVGTSTGGATATDMNLNSTHSTVKVAETIGADSDVDVVLTGITNPSVATSSTVGFYARIVTYDTSAHATSEYTYNATDEGADAKDDGGIAMAITNGIGVTAAVRETMTFCVSGDDGAHAGPSGACGADGGGSAVAVSDPKLTLGHGTPAALDASQTDTASDWAQISTNASSGAVVRMTNNNVCGGLERLGEPNYGTGTAACDIAPVGAGTAAAAITGGNALFGMLLSSASNAPASVATPTGTLAPDALYDGTSTHYGMGSDVSATYGDPIFDTASAPVANKNIKLTFAASASPTTPAGIYKATMNLIATGTF
jgi:hypothetical protein